MEIREDREGGELLTVYETSAVQGARLLLGQRALHLAVPANREPWLVRLTDAEGEPMGGLWVSEDDILKLAGEITSRRAVPPDNPGYLAGYRVGTGAAADRLFSLLAHLRDDPKALTEGLSVLYNELSRHSRPPEDTAEPRTVRPHYEAGSGIRPASRNGRYRGVAREVVPGGGTELHACDHDHAPGVADVRDASPAERDAAASCAATWLDTEIQAGRLHKMTVEISTD